MFTFHFNKRQEEAVGLLTRTPPPATQRPQPSRPFCSSPDPTPLRAALADDRLGRRVAAASGHGRAEHDDVLVLLLYATVLVGGGIAFAFVAAHMHASDNTPRSSKGTLITHPRSPSSPKAAAVVPRKRPVLAAAASTRRPPPPPPPPPPSRRHHHRHPRRRHRHPHPHPRPRPRHHRRPFRRHRRRHRHRHRHRHPRRRGHRRRHRRPRRPSHPLPPSPQPKAKLKARREHGSGASGASV